jgi:hypothetical protein
MAQRNAHKEREAEVSSHKRLRGPTFTSQKVSECSLLPILAPWDNPMRLGIVASQPAMQAGPMIQVTPL